LVSSSSSYSYVCFVDRCLSFCTFSFGIVLSVLHRYTDSDCPFGIFKLFFDITMKTSDVPQVTTTL
jgi:hypothetical protein